jgi:hypothetical protein
MSQIPVRIAHGWTIWWLDFYQAPFLAVDSVVSEIGGLFRELGRGKDSKQRYAMEINKKSTNKLGRPIRYADSTPF